LFVAVNMIAVAPFGERLTLMQALRIVLAVIAVGLITLGSAAK
jgi:multidrug transporter EmrE-like cation transporter